MRTSTHRGRSARGLLAAIVFATATAAVALAPAAPAAARNGRVTSGPPFAVGVRSYTFVDTSRPTPANRSFPGAPSRTVRTLLLYPAEGDPAGPPVKDAAPIASPHRFPLVEFSHGFTGNAEAYVPLISQWVRRGYVFAAPTFPLSSAGAPGGPDIADYVNQPADVSFVITQVLRLAHDDPTLRHTIDPHRIGAAGHSLGAITTLGVATNSCCLDRRIDAAVSLSGIELPFPNGHYFTEPTPPLMLVHGNADHTVPYAGSVNVYAQAPPPKVFLTLDGAPHTPFSPPWLEPIVRSVGDFFDAFLKGDRIALLRLPLDGNVPGVASLQADLCRANLGSGVEGVPVDVRLAGLETDALVQAVGCLARRP